MSGITSTGGPFSLQILRPIGFRVNLGLLLYHIDVAQDILSYCCQSKSSLVPLVGSNKPLNIAFIAWWSGERPADPWETNDLRRSPWLRNVSKPGMAQSMRLVCASIPNVCCQLFWGCCCFQQENGQASARNDTAVGLWLRPGLVCKRLAEFNGIVSVKLLAVCCLLVQSQDAWSCLGWVQAHVHVILQLALGLTTEGALCCHGCHVRVPYITFHWPYLVIYGSWANL